MSGGRCGDWAAAYGGRRVLVTGAGGFIGSHLVERLLSLGAEVTAFVRYSSRPSLGVARRWPRRRTRWSRSPRSTST